MTQAESKRRRALFAAERARRQMTQAEFAELLGISIRAVQSKEQGWRDWSDRDLHTLELLDKISAKKLT